MSLLGDFFKNPRESLSDAWGNIKNIAKDPFDKDNIKDNARMIFEFIDPAASSLYGTANSLDETFGGAQGGGGQSPYANIPLSNAGMEALPAAYQPPQAPNYFRGGRGFASQPGSMIGMTPEQAQVQNNAMRARYEKELGRYQLGLPDSQDMTGKYNQLAYDMSRGNKGVSTFDNGFNYQPATHAMLSAAPPSTAHTSLDFAGRGQTPGLGVSRNPAISHNQPVLSNQFGSQQLLGGRQESPLVGRPPARRANPVY